MAWFYNNNHKRNEAGKIIERDLSGHEGVECSNCKQEIKDAPAFSKKGEPEKVLGIDLGNVDYCHNCVDKFKSITR